MKKIVLSLLLIFILQYSFSQVINQPANWPNTSWALTGIYEPLSVYGDPTIDSNFSFDDADAGISSDIIAAESPIIDITSANTNGEFFLSLNSTYVFTVLDIETLALQYWDSDSNTWGNWGNVFNTITPGSPDFDYCDGPFVAFQSEQLDIQNFTATQLAGFRYRIIFSDNDDGGFGGGFCMASPTLTSQATITCLDPTNLIASNATINSVDLSWIAGGTEGAWEVAVQTQGTGVPTTNGQAVSTNPYTATGLTVSTDYEVYIRANCLADGFSDWIGPINFSTLTIPPPPPVGVTCATGSSSIVFMEDFGETEETAPLGWTGTGFDGDLINVGNWSITIAGTNSPNTGPLVSWDGNSGVHLEYEASDNAADIASAITPAIDLTAAVDGAELSFYMHAYGSAIGLLNIGVSTSATGPFTNVFNWNGELQTSDAESWVPVGVNLDAYMGQIVYIEFSYGADGSNETGDLSIDEIKVESCGDFCITPSDIVISNVAETSADIAWTSNGTESNWEYVVQPVGTGLPTISGTVTTATNASVTGLNPQTDYEVYVRANCLVDGFSLWYGPIPFETLKIPPSPPVGVTCTSGGIAIDIFTEDFGLIENAAPAGWTGTNFEGNLINGDWRITEADKNTVETGPLNSWDSNPGVHLEYESSGNTSSKATAITPAIDLTTALDGVELSFYMHAFGSTMGTFTVTGSLNPDVFDPFNTLFTWNGDLQDMEGDAWVPVGINLDGIIGNVIYLEFAYTGSGIGDKGDFAIDQIKIETCDPPACTDPTNLSTNNVTNTSIDISWDAGGTETAWEYVVQPADTGVPAANGTVTTTPNVTVTGLDPVTAYEVYVRANCLTDGFSRWVGPILFSTLKTPPPPPVGVNCNNGTPSVAFDETFGLSPNIDPSGWTGDFNGNAVNGEWRITNPGANTTNTGPLNSWDTNPGVHLEYEASGSATTIASAITPAIDLTSAVDGAELSFYMHAFGDAIGALSIGVSTSATGPFSNAYTWTGSLQTTDAGVWVAVGVNLDTYLGQTIFIEFSYGGDGTASTADIAIDTIKVESCGSFCLAPTNITTSSITDDSVVIAWDAGGTETAWEYVVQPLGTGVPSTNGIATTTTTNTVNGLNNATTYEVYVRANCLANGFSNWVGPINFTTLVLPPPPPVGADCTSGGTAQTIFTETFGLTPDTDPTGWTGTGFNGNIASGNWRITEPGANSPNTGPLNSWDTNPGVHLEYEASNNETSIASAITPALDLTSVTDSAELSFYLHAYGMSTGILNIGVSNSVTGPFTNVFTWNGQLQGSDDDAWIPVGVNLDVYVGQTIYIEFGYGGNGDNIFGDLAIDQINVESCQNTPVCLAPSNIVTSNVTTTSLDIAWTANNGETEWEYVVVPVGTTPPASGTTVTVPNANVTGLTPGTEYDIYVLSNCSSTLESPWAGPVPFTTLNNTCIIPTANIVDDISLCDLNSDGLESFNLAAQTAGILGTQDPNVFVVTYHNSLTDAQAGIGPVTPVFIAANGKEIFVRVEDTSSVDCANTSVKFTLFITGTIPDVSSPGDMNLCDDDSRDGSESFNIESNTPIILGVLDPSNYSVTYYVSETDAQIGNNPLSSPYNNISNPQTIYAKVETIGVADCFKIVDFNLIVNDVPFTTFDPNIKYEVCPNDSSAINISATANNYTSDDVVIQWFFEGVAIPDANDLELLNIGEDGTYTISVTFNGTRCSSETNVIVTELENCGITQAISPNGDNLNESFDLSGYNVQSLEIYNRFGTLVYSKMDYRNEWKGQSNDGDELPVGTYYYVMKYKGDQVRSAWIYINK